MVDVKMTVRRTHYNHTAMTLRELEKRLIAAEAEVARLKMAQGAPYHPILTLQAIHGAFENDAAFREASRLGRKWRKSSRPKVHK